jgi:hypothetical protein
MFTGQHPPVMSVCFGEQHLKSLDAWCRDLAAAVAHVKAHPREKLEGQCAVYGAAQVGGGSRSGGRRPTRRNTPTAKHSKRIE